MKDAAISGSANKFGRMVHVAAGPQITECLSSLGSIDGAGGSVSSDVKDAWKSIRRYSAVIVFLRKRKWASKEK